jgi:TolB-like protein
MAGNRVRITAQLIQADDGIGLWTENYVAIASPIARPRNKALARRNFS